MLTKEVEGLDYINNIEEATEIRKILEKLTDKVSISAEFLLLYGKTQMFYGDQGRSRGGHSENIGKTAKSMVRKTFKKMYEDRKNENPDLYKLNLEIYSLYAEIMGLSHDLGHTPLGHDGENVLNKKLYQMTAKDENLREQVLAERQELFSGITMEIDEKTAERIKKKDGIDIELGTYKYEEFQEMKRAQKGEKGIGFEHNEYSAQIFAKIFDELAEELKDTPYEEGIQKLDKNRFMTAIIAHSRSRFPAIPQDYLAQVVRQSDKVEYMNYDFEEYAKMGCFPLEKTDKNAKEYEKFTEVLRQRAEKYKVSETELREYMLLTGEERREDLEDGMVKEALEVKGQMDDNMKAMKMTKICAEFKDDILFYIDDQGKRGLITGNNVEREEIIIDKLIEFYKNYPDRIPEEEVKTRVFPLNEMEISDVEVVAFTPSKTPQNQYEHVKTYIASLTNEKCEEIYQELVQERIQEGKGHGISPVTQKEINAKLEHWRKKSTLQERSTTTDAYLPQEITDVIGKNRKIHQEQIDKDEALYQKMLQMDRKRESEKIREMHDQKSEQFFEDIESGKYNVPPQDNMENNNPEQPKTKKKFNIIDFQELAQTRRKETVAKVTNETIQEVRSNEQTKEKIAVGEER